MDEPNRKVEDFTEVHIFGAVYRVRGSEEEGYLQRVADLVDRKMREVSSHTRTADSAKIAILAALNLADELLRQTETRQQGERVEIKERVTALTGELAEALVR